MRVLIVDDSVQFREALVDLLADEPAFKVVGTAADGWEAVQMTRSKQPDLILMDLNMPVCDGLEATRHIKAEMPGVHILLLTASGADEVRAEAMRCGAEDCLNKEAERVLMVLEQLSGHQSTWL